jgi:hypothetical protein
MQYKLEAHLQSNGSATATDEPVLVMIDSKVMLICLSWIDGNDSKQNLPTKQ